MNFLLTHKRRDTKALGSQDFLCPSPRRSMLLCGKSVCTVKQDPPGTCPWSPWQRVSENETSLYVSQAFYLYFKQCDFLLKLLLTELFLKSSKTYTEVQGQHLCHRQHMDHIQEKQFHFLLFLSDQIRMTAKNLKGMITLVWFVMLQSVDLDY